MRRRSRKAWTLDMGYGDYYRLKATPEWCDYSGTAGYGYAGMYECDGARSYSPVNPMNENTAQFIIKKDGPYADEGRTQRFPPCDPDDEPCDPPEFECTVGVDCKFGFSEVPQPPTQPAAPL